MSLRTSGRCASFGILQNAVPEYPSCVGATDRGGLEGHFTRCTALHGWYTARAILAGVVHIPGKVDGKRVVVSHPPHTMTSWVGRTHGSQL